MASTFRFVWDGNVLLHETFKKDNSEHTELTTWVFEGFVPTAKLVNGKAYSIISDHLGTPILAIDSEGNEVWNRQLDIYGRVKREIKASSLGDDIRPFIPFLYQGQYYDFETNLAYNRFRYYSPETGAYISQDPIRLWGGMNLYSYVYNVNILTDIFGLDSTKLDKNLGGTVGDQMQAHHLIPEEVWKLNQANFDSLKMNMDSASNGVLLPDNESLRKQMGYSVYHRGSHPQYNLEVKEEVKKILSEYEKGKNDDDIRKRLETLQETLRERLKNGEGNPLSKKASGCKLG